MWIGHCKEIRKLTFPALALRRSESRNCLTKFIKRKEKTREEEKTEIAQRKKSRPFNITGKGNAVSRESSLLILQEMVTANLVHFVSGYESLVLRDHLKLYEMKL